MLLWAEVKEHLNKYGFKSFVEGSVSYSYIDVLEQVESLATTLTDCCYGILCSSELNTAIALLSCFASNAIAIPLSYRYGEAHCNRIIKQAGIQYVITDTGEVGKLIIKQVADQQFEMPYGERPSLIMYTSGTTGHPKGAMISETNLLCNVHDIQKYFTVNSADRILICRPLYHCAVLTGEFLISILNGLDIVFYSGDFNPFALCQQINKYKISVIAGTPTLLFHTAQMEKRLKKCDSLRVIVTSGECMTPVIAKVVREAFPSVDIYNVYGLTEASPRVSYLPPDCFDTYCTSVGLPLASLRAKVVSPENGQEMPFGEDGELVISGDSIMLGYYKDDHLTEQKIKNGWLYTGDIASVSKEGFITIKCRKDNMIIKAGMNIYPQEIENVVKQLPNIREAYVYSQKDEIGRVRIVLVVESDENDTSTIFKYCREQLPVYEIPDEIQIVEAIPKNGSGKIIRRK